MAPLNKTVSGSSLQMQKLPHTKPQISRNQSKENEELEGLLTYRKDAAVAPSNGKVARAWMEWSALNVESRNESNDY